MTITLTREEAEQVLDLMTRYRTETPLGHQPHMISHKADDAIETLRSRLSAPEPEEKKYTEESCPVCGYYCLGKGGVNCIDKPKLCGINNAPLQRKELDPVADKYLMEIECTKCGAKQDGILTVNTPPPQREWQGLTDEDKKQIQMEAGNKSEMTAFEYAQRVGEFTEAKLKEKNHV
jgi:DNA-directed RNA polymerase subunit RPC12/RpoP